MNPTTPLCQEESWATSEPPKMTQKMVASGLESCVASPIQPMSQLDEEEMREGVELSTPEQRANERTENCDIAVDNNSSSQQDFEDRRRREEEESIALARALMAEEAMAVSYHMSVDYLRNNRDQFSEEDLAALQAAMDDDQPPAGSDIVEENGEGDLSYDMMLRLGEHLGDVKTERWERVAKNKINQLPTFTFDRKSVKGKDENDCEVKCLVCQFSYEEEECLRRLPCGHCFHKDCVDQWLQSKEFCPYCRTSIVDDEQKS